MSERILTQDDVDRLDPMGERCGPGGLSPAQKVNVDAQNAKRKAERESKELCEACHKRKAVCVSMETSEKLCSACMAAEGDGDEPVSEEEETTILRCPRCDWAPGEMKVTGTQRVRASLKNGLFSLEECLNCGWELGD